MSMLDERPVVDFNYFYFERDLSNHQIAKEIAIILIDETDILEFFFLNLLVFLQLLF